MTEHREYPKQLHDFGVVAETAQDHKALLSGDAVVEVIQSAQGEIRRVRYLPKPAAPASQPEKPRRATPRTSAVPGEGRRHGRAEADRAMRVRHA